MDYQTIISQIKELNEKAEPEIEAQARDAKGIIRNLEQHFEELEECQGRDKAQHLFYMLESDIRGNMRKVFPARETQEYIRQLHEILAQQCQEVQEPTKELLIAYAKLIGTEAEVLYDEGMEKHVGEEPEIDWNMNQVRSDMWQTFDRANKAMTEQFYQGETEGKTEIPEDAKEAIHETIVKTRRYDQLQEITTKLEKLVEEL